jgi:hypothetical protein
METNTLTTIPQRGTLTFMSEQNEYISVQGWFMQEGETVVMRKVRGRNRSVLCSLRSVFEFVPFN